MIDYKKLDKIITFTAIIIMIYYLFNYIVEFDFPMILFTIIGIAIFLLVNFIDIKIFKKEDKTLLLLFLLLSGVLGSMVNLFKYISFYDNLMHFISGVLATYLAFKILNKENMTKNKNYYIFAIAFAGLIGSCWEILEYITDLTFNTDTQKVLLFGIDDTMQDIIYTYLGSLLYIGIVTKARK